MPARTAYRRNPEPVAGDLDRSGEAGEALAAVEDREAPPELHDDEAGDRGGEKARAAGGETGDAEEASRLSVRYCQRVIPTGVGPILTVWAGAASVVWLAALAAGLLAWRRIKRFDELDAPPPASWPRLSIVLAARDEQGTIRTALDTLLAQDYPDLEIVAVDDRSTDGTGAILDAAAARDPRVRALHVGALPDGWLGKVHALEVGASAATGTFIVFTDADVHFAKGALRRAIAWCEARGVDHLAVAPEIVPSGPLQGAVCAAFAAGFLLGTGAARVDRPGSTAYVGVGGFNLVRRAVFDRTPGFEWLRMEILDDVGLGLMMHRAGARKDFALGIPSVSIAWYPSLRAMIRGLEKNLFGGAARFRYGRVAGLVTAMAAVLPGPLLALVVPAGGWVRGAAAATLVALGLAALAARARTGASATSLFLAPLGAAILGGILVRSAWRCARRGGIVWRETFYPVAALRAGRRVELGRPARDP